MLLGNLNHPETYNKILNGHTWEEVFGWIKSNIGDSVPFKNLPPDGKYEIREEKIRAIVFTTQAKDRSEKDYEAHRREIDIHLCLEGSEMIEWIPVKELAIKEEYDEQKDSLKLHKPDQPNNILKMTPGMIAIFFPGEAHLPELKLEHDQVKKVVLKATVSKN